MPTFDPDIAKMAQRVLIGPRDIETRAGLIAKTVTPGSPVVIELADLKTKEVQEVLEVDACLVATGRIPATKDLGLERVGVETDRRGFIPVNEQLQVVRDGEPVPHLWAIGDATGKIDAGPRRLCPGSGYRREHLRAVPHRRLYEYSGSGLYPS